MVKDNVVFVILGPTCTGKTSLAVNLCKDFNGEIISADSRQVYKYMDVGTGKTPVGITEEAQTFGPLQNGEGGWHLSLRVPWSVDGINIWGYDLTTPDQYFSAYNYARFALSKAKELQEQGKAVFLVGGTGFYIDVFTRRRQLAGLKPDFELRKSLETTPTKNMLTWLTSLNPTAVEKIDTKNRVRIIRALEIALAKEEKNVTPLPYLSNTNFVFIGLTASRKVLYAKVDAWLDTVWKNGLLDEIKHLWELGYKKSSKLSGLVYKEAVSFLEGELDAKEAIQRAKFSLHAYVRRQQTYFKKNEDIVWFNIEEDSMKQRIYNKIKKVL